MAIKSVTSRQSEMGKLLLVGVAAATIAKVLERLLDSLIGRREIERRE